MRDTDRLAAEICRHLGDMRVIDAHEHLADHVGYEGVWEDFRETDPSKLVPVFMRYRELGMIALAFPNVWLNQCWAHAALDGWLDMVPANKIIAWGKGRPHADRPRIRRPRCAPP